METSTVLARAPEIVTATAVRAAINVDEIGRRRRATLDSSPSPSPSSRRSSASGVLEPSPKQTVHGVHVYHQQEVANNSRPRPSILLSPGRDLEPGRTQRLSTPPLQHLSDTDTTANHSAFSSPRYLQQQHQITSPESATSSGVSAQIKDLIDVHGLSREQFLSIYDDYVREKDQQARLSISMAHAQAHAAAMLNSSSLVAGGGNGRVQVVNSDLNNNHSSSPSPPLHEQQQQQQFGEQEREDGLPSSHIDVVDLSANSVPMDETDATGDSEIGGDENSSAATSVAMIVDGGEGGEEDMTERSHVGKMQTLVRTAMESYETASPVTSEIGQKRKHFTLEEELRLQPSPFAQQLLERDQTLVAQAIKRYMNQYSIPQREVVEKTGLNQSHLSQHFLHGVTMKRAKRIKLYHWFEEDQKARTGKLQSADGSLNAVLESPKVEGSRRRPRWKWSPISTQILTEAFKKNQFPTREQRLELSRVCNDAELAMNNGAMIRGPEGDTEGITEQRINTWFTNRRKGLTTPVTPSPTKALTPGCSSLPFTTFHPTLLRAGPATTPVLTPGSRSTSSTNLNCTPKFGSLTTTPLTLSSTGEEGKPSPVALIPNTVQTLVSQIQQAQVHHHHHQSGVTVAGAPSAQVISSSPSSHLQSSPHLALPLAIALPSGCSANVLPSSPHSFSTAPTHMQTVAVSPTVNPNAIQAFLSQLHGTSAITAPLQLTPAGAVSNSSNLIQPTSIITLPAAHGTAVASPVHLHNRHHPPPLTSSSTTSGSMAVSSAFKAATVVNSRSGINTKTTVNGSGGKGVFDHIQQATGVATLSQAQLQALMSQVQSAKVIDGTSPMAPFQLLTLPAGISLATPSHSGVSISNEPPSVLWASNGQQGVPQTS